MDSEHCEIDRLYAVSGNAPTFVFPLSFVAPRKVVKFHDDLYEAPAAAAEAACSAEEWTGGWKGEAVTVSLDPAIRKGAGISTREAEKKKQEEERSFRRWNEAPTVVEADNTLDDTPIEPVYDAEEVAKYEEVEYKSVSVVRSSHFRHVFGQSVPSAKHIQGIAPSRNTSDGASIACSSAFFGVPIDGAGGRLAVLPTSYSGRLPDNFSAIETGSTILDFAFGVFNPRLIVTAQDNANVQLWTVPEEGLALAKDAANVTDETSKLQGHKRKVTSVLFNDVADNLLASASSAAGELKIWDVATSSPAFGMEVTRLFFLCVLDNLFLFFFCRVLKAATISRGATVASCCPPFARME